MCYGPVKIWEYQDMSKNLEILSLCNSTVNLSTLRHNHGSLGCRKGIFRLVKLLIIQAFPYIGLFNISFRMLTGTQRSKNIELRPEIFSACAQRVDLADTGSNSKLRHNDRPVASRKRDTHGQGCVLCWMPQPSHYMGISSLTPWLVDIIVAHRHCKFQRIAA